MLRSSHCQVTRNLNVEEFNFGHRRVSPGMLCFSFTMVPPSGHNKDIWSEINSRCKRNDLLKENNADKRNRM